MSQILNILYLVLGMVLLFGAAVFVHEFGHFWVAKKLGMKVEAFAIGFGPKIVSWTRDGIEYSLRWIPAGGFVKLPQMVTSEAIEGKAADGEPVPPAPPLHRILVAVAGPFMNIVFAFIIAVVIYFVGLPVLMNPSIIGYVDPESPEYAMGIREGDRVVSVDGKLTKSWMDVQETTILARTNVLPVVIEREGVSKTYQLTAKVNSMVGLKILNLDPKDHPRAMDVLSDGAGAAAGIQRDDVVISFAGVPIAGQGQFISLVEKRPGQETEIVLERAGQKVTLKVTPRLDPVEKVGRIGVRLGSSTDRVYILQKPGPKPVDQLVEVWDRTVKTLSALFHSKQTGVGVKDLSGPPGILAMLAAQLNEDYRLALNFLVLLNVNLAILNMMPIPVLDGGHILMALVEKIRRRPVSVRLQEYTTTAFAVALISFMLYVSFNDVTKRFGLFKSMFQGESRIEEAAPPVQPPLPVAPDPAQP